MSEGVRNRAGRAFKIPTARGVTVIESGGMFGIVTARGTGTPWIMQISAMNRAGWKVHKSFLYCLYKPPVSAVVRKDKQATIQRIYRGFLLSYTFFHSLIHLFPRNQYLMITEQRCAVRV